MVANGAAREEEKKIPKRRFMDGVEEDMQRV